MRLLNGILGVFAIFGSLYCTLYTQYAFLNAGFIIAFLLGAWGISAIIIYAASNERAKLGKRLLICGIIGLVLGIAALAVTAYSIVAKNPNFSLLFFIMLLFVLWLIFEGIAGIVVAARRKRQTGKGWVLGLILGIAVLVMGVLSLVLGCFGLIVLGHTVANALFVYGVALVIAVFDTYDVHEEFDMW